MLFKVYDDLGKNQFSISCDIEAMITSNYRFLNPYEQHIVQNGIINTNI